MNLRRKAQWSRSYATLAALDPEQPMSMVFAQSSGSGDFFASHMPEIKAMVEHATRAAWNQTPLGQILIGVTVALISGLISHAWGYARGFEQGRRRQQSDKRAVPTACLERSRRQTDTAGRLRSLIVVYVIRT